MNMLCLADLHRFEGDLSAIAVQDKWLQRCHRDQSYFGAAQEGYVLRHVDAFPVADYALHVAKFVSGSFTPVANGWRQGRYEPNRFAD